MRPKDTLYTFVERTSGDLAPVLLLEDFGGNPLRIDNLSDQRASVAFEYTFTEDGNYRLRITACCGDKIRATGGYRLLLGINAPPR